MKRITIFLSLIFALAIALSVSIPTLAAESGTTTVSGSLGAKIDVTAPSAIPSEGKLVLEPGATATDTSATPGNVKANKGNWYVVVTGDDYTMYSAATPTTKLAADFQVNIGAGLVDIDTAPYLTSTSKTGGTSIPLGVSQAVSWDDEAADDYQIVITFQGTYTAP